MAEINPAGTMVVELIAELMDLLANPNISRIEVVLGSYELDVNGARKLVNGKESITLRSFGIGGLNEEVRAAIREEFEAGPITLLMILWTDRSRDGSPGVITFDAVTSKKSVGRPGYDVVQKSAIASYATRHAG